MYGYYLLRSLSAESKLDDGGMDKPVEKIEFDAKSIVETVEKLALSEIVTIIADTSGIVQAKAGEEGAGQI